MKKVMLILLAIVFVSTMAFAGNRPEFDAVGMDSQNYFNDFIKDMVVNNAYDGFGRLINKYSDFTQVPVDPKDEDKGYLEYFKQTAGMPFPDPCFPDYLSSLAVVFDEAIYTWQIVLQMKPESDINLNIVDCVMKHNEFYIWTGAEQTGRYRAPWGELYFIPSANPSVTAIAYPGKYATPGFNQPFYMDARMIPGLGRVPVKDTLYTSKALWEEGIVMVMPETGLSNTLGQPMFYLHQGDYIKITVTIPFNNTADIRYGQDNVVLKYIGIVGTEFVND